MLGAGKYDDAATVARESCKAVGAVLLICDGEKGSGFSIQGPRAFIRILPDALRQMADSIERDWRAGLEAN